MRALLARQIDAKARPRPSSAENRPAIDPSEPILAVSPNFDRATDRRQPNHSTPNSDPQVRQTASTIFTRGDQVVMQYTANSLEHHWMPFTATREAL